MAGQISPIDVRVLNRTDGIGRPAVKSPCIIQDIYLLDQKRKAGTEDDTKKISRRSIKDIYNAELEFLYVIRQQDYKKTLFFGGARTTKSKISGISDALKIQYGIKIDALQGKFAVDTVLDEAIKTGRISEEDGIMLSQLYEAYTTLASIDDEDQGAFLDFKINYLGLPLSNSELLDRAKELWFTNN